MAEAAIPWGMTNSPKLLTILFADIGSSAALYDRVGDTEAYRLVADSLTRMKLAIGEHQGKVLRTVGDSVLASFDHSDYAFLGARAIQLAHADMPLSVRIGFHTGSVIPDGGDVYGHAVNIAARVAAFARVDEIMATEAAVGQLSEQHQAFVSSGDLIEVRGVPDAISVHRLQWQEQWGAVTRLATRTERLGEDCSKWVMRVQFHGSSWMVGADCCDLSLGRADDNDVTVHNDEASRHHAQILFKHGQFVLHDTSTNGTYVRKDALLPFAVRRDSIVMDGSGVICLGAAPEQAGSQLIDFQILQQ